MPKPEPVPFTTTSTPVLAEQETVHEVYEAIAPHFSQTRHKGWPLVTTFLDSLPPNTIGLDSGAGNGKYIPHASSSSSSSTSPDAGEPTKAKGSRYVIALDMARGLLDIAKTQLDHGAECLRAELGYGGWRDGVFDWAISVAAIHHLTTPERRKHSVKALTRPLVLNSSPPYSRFLIYVWAYEQGKLSKRKMGAATTIPKDAGAGADADPGTSSPAIPAPAVTPSNTDTEAKIQDVLVPWVYQPPPSQNDQGEKVESEKKVYHRYYHLFVKGELGQMVVEAMQEDRFRLLEDTEEGEGVGQGEKWMRIKGEGWEADNWWLEGEVGVGVGSVGL